MSLEGNLTAFGLSEILQLIAVQQKSGMLSISSDEYASVLFLREGHIISTRDRRRRVGDPLRDYLTRYGVLSREELSRLGDLSAQAKIDITDIIVSEGLMTADDMKSLFRDHIQEAVHEILSWEQCSYKFVPGLDIIDGIKSWGEFNVEAMLMESMRRIDELPFMLEIFPDVTMRISKTGEPTEDQEISTNEETMLQLLQAERSLGYLIAHGKVPKFCTYEALKHLYDKKLITYYLETETDPEDTTPRVKAKPQRRERKNLLPFIIALLLFLGALVWGARAVLPHIKAIVSGRGFTHDDSSVARNRAEETIRWALEAYYATNGVYPRSLDALAKTGFADDAFYENVKRHAFRYRLTGGGHRYMLL